MHMSPVWWETQLSGMQVHSAFHVNSNAEDTQQLPLIAPLRQYFQTLGPKTHVCLNHACF